MADLQEQVAENDDQHEYEDGIALNPSISVADSGTSRDGTAGTTFRDHLPSHSAPAPTTDDSDIMNDKTWPTSRTGIDKAHTRIDKARTRLELDQKLYSIGVTNYEQFHKPRILFEEDPETFWRDVSHPSKLGVIARDHTFALPPHPRIVRCYLHRIEMARTELRSAEHEYRDQVIAWLLRLQKAKCEEREKEEELKRFEHHRQTTPNCNDQ
jgi:hypothetical protein